MYIQHTYINPIIHLLEAEAVVVVIEYGIVQTTELRI